MTPEETVIAAAETTANLVGTDRFLKLTKSTLGFCGKEIARCIPSGERASFFSPVDFEIDGKERGGALLTLESCAIFAWIVGTLRIKNFEEAILYASVRSVAHTTRPGSAFTADVPMIRVEANANWTLIFANVFEGGKDVTPLIAGVLEGSITPHWNDEDDAGSAT